MLDGQISVYYEPHGRSILIGPKSDKDRGLIHFLVFPKHVQHKHAEFVRR